jgi:hypothetical protein
MQALFSFLREKSKNRNPVQTQPTNQKKQIKIVSQHRKKSRRRRLLASVSDSNFQPRLFAVQKSVLLEYIALATPVRGTCARLADPRYTPLRRCFAKLMAQYSCA